MPKVVIDNFPQTITAEDFSVSVTISGAKNGTNYLRIELYKEGSKNYFGETFNGKDWNSNSIGEDYFPINITSATSSATFRGRIGNPNSEEYLGSGDYKLKIKRYTQSGNAASGDDEKEVDVKINYEIATPIPSPSQTPVIEIVTATPEILKTETPIATLKATSTPQVLAYETETSLTPTPLTATFQESTKDSFSVSGAIIFFAGLFLLGISFYLIYNGRHVTRNKKVS